MQHRFLVAIAFAALGLLIASQRPADASPHTASLGVLHQAAAQIQGGGRAIGFDFVADATGTPNRIQGDEGDEEKYSAIACSNLSTTKVFIGDADADDDGNSYEICNDTAACAQNSIALNVRSLYAHSASGSVTLECIAIQ